ncbi:MAG: ribokinase [Paracoccaceae bacterium]
MTIWNLGSINADHVYGVPHLPGPGETIAATSRARYLGGKGANMSVAAARAGARAAHVGAVGPDGAWAVGLMLEWGVDTRHVARVAEPTAQALIFVDASGENQIVLDPGANLAIPEASVQAALAEASPGDWWLTQNETGRQVDSCRTARALGLRVAHAAAPFEADAVVPLLGHLDLLVLNAVEAEQLRAATGRGPADLGVADVVVTLGGEGAVWLGRDGERRVPAVPVTPVDTTGAGDTATGYLLAGLDRGQPLEQALGTAMRAGALMVTRHGTADVIPDLSEVQAFGG